MALWMQRQDIAAAMQKTPRSCEAGKLPDVQAASMAVQDAACATQLRVLPRRDMLAGKLHGTHNQQDCTEHTSTYLIATLCG